MTMLNDDEEQKRGTFHIIINYLQSSYGLTSISNMHIDCIEDNGIMSIGIVQCLLIGHYYACALYSRYVEEDMEEQ